MYTTIRMRADELTEEVLMGIKKMFKGKTITIAILETEEDETDYLMSVSENRAHIDQSLSLRKEKRILVTSYYQ